MINLGLLGGLDREYIHEAGETAAPVYDALVAALAEGELDGALAGGATPGAPGAPSPTGPSSQVPTPGRSASWPAAAC